ncbi:hypothetical protein BDV40DRAFT_299289 [Aspergillus tamarii]|uniref:Uncharacterized protein n=1 Tax=Aspergillus tamarii TaxID=41984 RepID=A0A5N6UY01_ASPTM|nr:hypothetical protein BDV40DRAFT_299289 [Aspergillus tamarii]
MSGGLTDEKRSICSLIIQLLRQPHLLAPDIVILALYHFQFCKYMVATNILEALDVFVTASEVCMRKVDNPCNISEEVPFNPETYADVILIDDE